MMLAYTDIEYLIGTIALIIFAPYFIWHVCIAAPKQAKLQERRKLARKRDLVSVHKPRTNTPLTYWRFSLTDRHSTTLFRMTAWIRLVSH